MTTETSEAFRLTVREKCGPTVCNELRRQGMVPGILYGAGKDNVSLAVDVRDLEKGLNTTNFYTRIYHLSIGGGKEQAMVREVQFHPVSDRPIHIDFMRVSKGTRIHVRVPVVFKNDQTSPGLKRGGVLNVIVHSLEVTCSVDHVPDHIDVDLTGLDIGHSVHTSQIHLGEGVVVSHPERDNTLATIAAPTVHKVEEETAPAAAEQAAEASAQTPAPTKS